MRRAVIGFATGSLFSIGLMVSRMADPAKVLNFLNITQNWDPSLALVMAGGVLVATLGFALARRWQHPWFDRQFPALPRGGISPRLLIGAALFGAGWGLIGLCPGPALVALMLDPHPVFIFIVGMLVGLWGVRLIDQRFGPR